MISQPTPITGFTVYRPQWARGFISRLLVRRGDLPLWPNKVDPSMIGTCCCLGQLALTCGYPATHVAGQGYPSDLVNEYEVNRFPTCMANLKQVHEDLRAIVQTNDDPVPDILEPEREAQLTKLFARLGLTVVFSDEQAPWAAEALKAAGRYTAEERGTQPLA